MSIVVAPTGQMVRRVNKEAIVLLGWGRAILLQLAHPLVAAAVADHSDYWSSPLQYLRRIKQTVGSMLDLTFGSQTDIQLTADRINAIHDRVHGRVLDDTRLFPAGTAYTATDPALLTWVHVTLIHSQILAYELFVKMLRTEEKDQYCRETAELAPLLRIPTGVLPTTYAKLTGHLQTRYNDGTVQVTDTARRLSRSLLYPPGGPVTAACLALGRLVTSGLLPDPIRSAYGLPWTPVRQRSLDAVAWGIRSARVVTPTCLREWPMARRSRQERLPRRCPIH